MVLLHTLLMRQTEFFFHSPRNLRKWGIASEKALERRCRSLYDESCPSGPRPVPDRWDEAQPLDESRPSVMGRDEGLAEGRDECSKLLNK